MTRVKEEKEHSPEDFFFLRDQQISRRHPHPITSGFFSKMSSTLNPQVDLNLVLPNDT
jgi:hypothetical protein